MQSFSRAHHIKACLGFKSLPFFSAVPCLNKFSLPVLAISSLLLLSFPTVAFSNSSQALSNNDLNNAQLMADEEGLLPAPKNIDANSNPEHEFVLKQKQSKQLEAANIDGATENSELSAGNSALGKGVPNNGAKGSLIDDNIKIINTNTRSGALAGGGVTSTAGLIKWLLSTVAILGIIFVLAYVLKKSRLVQRTTGSSMTLIGQMAVGPKERLVQIKVGERYLLLGVTSQNVNLVADLSSDFAKEPQVKEKRSKEKGTKQEFLNQASLRAQKERLFAQDNSINGNEVNSNLNQDNSNETSSLEAYWDDPVFSKHLDGKDQEAYRPNNGRYTKEQLENLGYWFESELDYHEGHNFDINQQPHEHSREAALRAGHFDSDAYDDFTEQELDALYKEHLAAAKARRRLSRRNPLGNDYYAMPNDDVLKQRAKRAKIDLAQSRKMEQKFGNDDFGTIFNQAYDQAQEKLNIDPIVPQNNLNSPEMEQGTIVQEVSEADLAKHQELSTTPSGSVTTLEPNKENHELDSDECSKDKSIDNNEVEVDVLLAIDEAVENSKPIKSSSFEETTDANQVNMINDEDEPIKEDSDINHNANKSEPVNNSKYVKGSKRKGRNSKARNF